MYKMGGYQFFGRALEAHDAALDPILEAVALKYVSVSGGNNCDDVPARTSLTVRILHPFDSGFVRHFRLLKIQLQFAQKRMAKLPLIFFSTCAR